MTIKLNKLKWLDLLVALLTLVAGIFILSYSPSLQLPTDLVRQAIVLQLTQANEILTQQLGLADQEVANFQVDNLIITQEKSITIQNLPALQVRGTYNLTVNSPKQRVKKFRNPFEIYLQVQAEGKTWRLARPIAQDGDTWATRIIQSHL